MSDRANTLAAESADHRSIAEILRDILQDIGRMVKAEIRLARTELGEQARKAGKAAGMFGGAAVCGLLAAACFVTCAIAALALVMAVWLAALIMGVLLAVIAGGAYVAGRKRLDDVDVVPQQTAASLKENVEWAKQRTK